VAVRDWVSGALVDGHDPGAWARVLTTIALNPACREELAGNAVGHARRFSWDRTTDSLLAGYAEARDVFREEVIA
jgi:D-inositol-3-phosphate glycosyltransferase